MEARGSERRPQDRKPANWTARILASLAIALAAAGIVLIVSGGFGDGDGDGDEGKRERAVSTGCAEPDADEAIEDGYYVIEPGEDLSVVADRTCIPVEELIELNENLDPQAIPVGGCVDLRLDGCKALAEG